MRVKRRDVLKSLGVLTASSAFGCSKGARDTGSPAKASLRNRPNILVFLSDDHGQWLQHAYGNSEVRTPNTDRICCNAVRMTNAFTTCPVCSPARASFFTGRMPSQHGIHDWIQQSTQAYAYPWLKGQTLLSELLKNAGYHTGMVGKWHCGEERYPHPGFDSSFGYWVNQQPHLGEQDFSDNGRHVKANGFQSPLLTKQAIHFLRTHYSDNDTADKPFFLFISYTDTHLPHTSMPDDLLSLYNTAIFRDIPDEPFSKAHGMTAAPVSRNPAIEHAKRKQYYAAASSIDREVGHVLDELQSMEKLDDTLVVYTGDHGLNAGQHGMWEKGEATIPQNFLEESIRVPCMVSWPNGGIARDLQSDLLVNHCDLFATLLDVAQALPNAKTSQEINSPGRSYLSQLRGELSQNWTDTTICEYGNARMIRKNGYKLILRYPYKGVTFANELYDLRADERETTNIYTHPSYSRIIKDMSNQLDGFFSRYTVPGHSGLDLEHQPLPTFDSPWLEAVRMKSDPRFLPDT